MEFSGEIIKKGTSQVGDLRIEYNITYDVNNTPQKATIQIYRDKQQVGQASIGAIGNQIQFSLFNVGQTTVDERIAVYTEVERTIDKLFNEGSN